MRWKILAKAEPEKTLYEHILDVLKVLSEMMKIYSDVPRLCGEADFWDYVFYALFFHDFGKSAIGFQEALRTGRRWGYRHEIISAGFVSCLEYEDRIKRLIALGIASHHKELDELKKGYSTISQNSPGYERYINALREVGENFDELVEMMKLIPELSQEFIGKRLINFNLPSSVDDLVDVFRFAIKPYEDIKDSEIDRLTWLRLVFMRGFVLGCDYLASSNNFEIPRLGAEISRFIKFEKLNDIQLKLRRADEVRGKDIILVAPTGYGKTEASLFWVESNQDDVMAKRVFYILPYTASINDMFKRFVQYFGGELVGIKHYRAGYFLYKFFRDREYTPEEAKKIASAFVDLSKKIYKQFKLITYLQLLKGIFGVDGFEMELSEMAGGLVVLDEVHSYNAKIIALLVEALKILKNQFGVKVLIMSATFPKFLREIFETEVGIKELVNVDESELRKISRHRINLIDDNILNGVDLIKNFLVKGLRVLVVCNTVKRAQDVYTVLSEYARGKSKLVHSRFALVDRERIEGTLKDENVQLLVGTQAIEVSLDIDFDVLFTDVAPVDRLIQRFGRVNRRGRMDCADVYIFNEYLDEDLKIYEKEILERTIAGLGKVKRINEFDILNLIEDVYSEGFTEKQKKIFEETKESFLRLRSSIVPMFKNPINEEDFNSLTGFVEVVPSYYEDDYLSAYEEGNYFDTVKFYLPLAYSQFFKLAKMGQIYKRQPTVFCRAKYDKELGLLVDEFETNILE
ncbi:CRISPR-associated endonuclease/helicase Cas3 [Candidatus Kryptonium thompsonii]|jgi:CRISPR-associated endonuclease/helicase Cas3|uniref:CRISPR-associated endonuclease/helicase Cas3 n=1 Tax=Candidatus Kryptonium thompsonii TaxID=1633631 RepID=A0A0P1MZT9_9BACT|nr:CRISPR-associated helicase/endonuclease Cas3 [Candidatus Kryptonium thompsoni]CUS82625.1 CRISPR-associated endonuclease/helicase Cas3 [Candidatus Kryptonium thompsoni]CUS83360.1 CRISPR-associated endonuclease/helicase Cas3 [Candidatus Kryptonium thompsoni]CUS87649.1 CRISPR-associated endonuclease/helicase Cas3 [Candidatus Kryptonium thompsoni]CUS92776.1 CRISPR-associated endonuclease/helicase Cas3 [Candidatus Kryptonium thompsoni]CUS94684.1 CRISPR-associated endonuclease/helicase Cas3 [Cand